MSGADQDDENATLLGDVRGGGKFAFQGNLEYDQQQQAEAAIAQSAGDGTRNVGDAGIVTWAPSSGSVPAIDVGVQMTPDGPDGLCVVTDFVDLIAGLVPCDGRASTEEAQDSEETEDEEASADESEPIVITVTRSDFAELPLERPGVHLQPDRDWFLVNMDTLVYTDGGSQMLETTVLDVPVAVRATPVEYSWDFGDGSEPLVTAEPGAPWPAEDIGHVYTSEASDVVITLTTTWSGEFQVAGQGPWIPIAGTTTTHSQSSPFRIDAVETHLTAEG